LAPVASAGVADLDAKSPPTVSRSGGAGVATALVAWRLWTARMSGAGAPADVGCAAASVRSAAEGGAPAGAVRRLSAA
jgi:hypothetical protein